jgi:hypothetical protein
MVRRGMLVGVNLGIRLTGIDRTQLKQLFTSIIVPEKQITSKVYELCFLLQRRRVTNSKSSFTG